MNEKIRKLYEQAHESKPVIALDPATGQPVHCTGHNGKPLYHRELNLEKFAELIIETCIQVGGPEDSYRDEWFHAKADSVNKMKNYFGVEG